MGDALTNPVAVVAAIGLIITLLSAAGGLIWKAARWVQKVDSDTSGLRELAEEVRDNLQLIHAGINDIVGRLSSPQTVQSGSPIQLTEFGRKIAAKLQARQWAAELAPTQAGAVEGKRPFEIDEFSNNYVKELSQEWRDRVAECAYEFGVSEDSIRSVLRVVLRDELIKLRTPPETSQQEGHEQ